MSTREQRVKEATDKLIGEDAAPRIRGMGQYFKQLVEDGRRKAEVDGPAKTTDVLDVPVMAFEDRHGNWKIETIGDFFPGQNGNFSATDKNERLAMAEFRFRMVQEFVTCRWLRVEDARSVAGKARVTVHGRVPFHRIITTVV